MTTTPRGSRPHVVIFGETNSGKSALFNALIGARHAIVSDVEGTTTDPVTRQMELLGFGPISLTDTAGLNDHSKLGKERMKKTARAYDSADLGLYVLDAKTSKAENQKPETGIEEYQIVKDELGKRGTPVIVVFTKKDLYGEEAIEDFKLRNELTPTHARSVNVSIEDIASIERLREKIGTALRITEAAADKPLIADFVQRGESVIAAVVIDSESPKGRLILPQMMFIRECVDYGINCMVSDMENLSANYNKLQPKLVVVDSQVFPEAAKFLPKDAGLTSFSILMARQKGELGVFLDGIKAIKGLRAGAKILIAEACTHNTNHEDIGRVKIPAALNKISGKSLEFVFAAAREFPDNLSGFDLIVLCGGCMLTRKEMTNRLRAAKEHGIAVTNYGILLAHAGKILERSVEVFEEKRGNK